VFGKRLGKRFKKINIIAGYGDGKVIAPLIYEGTMTSQFFNEWVEKILIPSLEPHQIILMDNASFHRSAQMRKLLENAGHQVIFIFPSTHLNSTPLSTSGLFLNIMSDVSSLNLILSIMLYNLFLTLSLFFQENDYKI